MTAATGLEITRPYSVEQADTLAEIAADVSVVLGHEGDASPEQQMASATIALRRMRGIQRDIAQIEERTRLECEAIQGMADRELAPLRIRFAHYEAWVQTLAQLIEWPKRKKSHDTPYGAFGVRVKPANLKVTDEARLLEWAEEHAQKFVKREVVLAWGDLKKTLDPSEDTLPPGVEVVPETVTPFAKVAA